ncbi:MAG: O-antigen ligase family protein [Candidatus Omnitrophica bacterium]|nr:O-antigen ligase family protein [Candidatus Omnitrophota bacterium]
MMEQTANKQSKASIVFMTILACSLAYIITKEVEIPTMVMVAVGLAIGVFLLVKGLSKPAVVTYVLVAYLPFSKELAGDFGGLATAFNFTNILMGFVMLVWLSGRFSAGEPLWLSSRLNVPIYLFLFAGLISIARGSYFEYGHISHAIINYKRWITPIFMYFLVLNTVKDRDTIKNITTIIIIVTTIAALMAIYDYIDLGNVSSLDKSRIGGIADQPNMLAAFFNYYMFLPFGFFLLNMKNKKYWLLLIPFFICFRGIMVTFSRGGYIAFAAAFIAIAFFKSRSFFVLTLIIAGALYMNPLLIPGGVRYRMGQTVEKPVSYGNEATDFEGTLDSSARARVEVWKGAVRMIQDHPFFGVGYDLFQPMITYYWIGERPIDAHNTYLIIAAEMGIPALMIFLWIIWRTFRETLYLYKRTQNPFSKALALGFLGGLFGLLASNLFGSRLDSQEVSSYFWILAALVVRLKILDEHEKKNPSIAISSNGNNSAHTPTRPVRRDVLDAVWRET